MAASKKRKRMMEAAKVAIPVADDTSKEAPKEGVMTLAVGSVAVTHEVKSEEIGVSEMASEATAEMLKDAQPITELIKVRAYELWEAAGKPAGNDGKSFWYAAEAEILGSDG